MPRPKSDLKAVSFKLGEADRALLAELAETYSPPNANEAVRDAIREAARKWLKARDRRPRP